MAHPPKTPVLLSIIASCHCPDKVCDRARWGVASLAAGQVLTVIDPEGTQIADLLAYSADDVREVISNGRTFDYEETIALTTGARLWSNRSRLMLTLFEGSVGQHDFLLTPCSEATFRHFYPDQPIRRGCFGTSPRHWLLTASSLT